MLDLRPIFREEGHVTRALDAGGALPSDRFADRIEVEIWVVEEVVVGECEAVDIQLVVHDVSHRLLVRAKQREVDDLGVTMSCLPDEVGRAGNCRVHPPEDDPESLGHDFHDLGVERDYVHVAQGDGGRRIDEPLEQTAVDVEAVDPNHPV